MMVGPSHCGPLGVGRYHESYLEKDGAVGRGGCFGDRTSPHSIFRLEWSGG